jgi:uncharacterized membrane protein YbhN (UPF0104 family)
MGDVKPKRWTRWLRWALVALGTAFVLRAAWRFPWSETGAVLLRADARLLLLAALVSPISFLVKGWAWHLLLRPVAPHRWKEAQAANWIGAMVNVLSISLAGEATRIHRIVRRAGVPVGKAVASVALARTCEVIGLALFILIAPSLLHRPLGLRHAQIAAAGALALLAVLLVMQRFGRLPGWLPAVARSTLSLLSEIGSPRRLRWPVFFALIDWSVQWTTFHMVLAATHAHPSPAASLMAVLATNLVGVLRLTPSNVGIFQVSMAIALRPYGIAAGQAVAAGLALQAVQIPPVLIIGAFWLGWRGIKQLRVEGSSDLAVAAPEMDDPAGLNGRRSSG